MPPSYVKTIRQLIYWEYAKLMAESAGLPDNFGFIVNRYKALDSGKIKMNSILKEDQKQLKEGKTCIYCGCEIDLSYDRIIPKSKGGPDNNKMPRLVKGKYPMLVYEFHNKMGTLDRFDMNKDGKLDVMDLNIFNILFDDWER